LERQELFDISFENYSNDIVLTSFPENLDPPTPRILLEAISQINSHLNMADRQGLKPAFPRCFNVAVEAATHKAYL
jgi:hypothetical protein